MRASAGSGDRLRMPAGIWVLGFVSLLTDISSELIHSLLPIFLVGTLGVGVLALGVIEGIAEAAALATKALSGAWSDRLGRRKPLALLGYAISACTKPAFALATGAGLVLTARVADRLGKGVRDAPRDALVADLAPERTRGAAFGLRQALDTVGALLGPLLAIGLMLLWAGDIRAVFWVAVVPAALAVALLAFGVREPGHRAATGVQAASGSALLSRAALAGLPGAYWRVVALGAVFTLARFSEAFLILRAQQLGLAMAWLPLVMVVMNAVYAASAYPFGRLADGMSHTRLLSAGLAVLVVADLVLALATGWAALFAGVALWGMHMGMTQGLLAAMVADSAPADARGTAFGLFNLVAGAAMLAASVTAGLMWQTIGPAATFATGAAFAGMALAALLYIEVRSRSARRRA